MTQIPLLDLHSWEADDVLAYFGELETKLARRWFGAEQRAIVCHTRPRGDGLEQASPGQTEEPLTDLAAPLERVLLLGDPNAGRIDWLRQLAITTARASTTSVREFEQSLDDICIPVYLRLPIIAELLPKTEALSKTLLGCKISDVDPGRINNAERFAAAMLLALHNEYNDAFSPRCSRVLWYHLWSGKDRRGNARALVILDGLDEVAPAERERLYDFLHAFLENAGARIFVGSRFIGPIGRFVADGIIKILDLFGGERGRILCSWPYQIWIPSPVPGVASPLIIADFDRLRLVTSDPRYQRRLQIDLLLGINRPLLVRRHWTLLALLVIFGLTAFGLSIWSDSRLTITIPTDGGSVCGRSDVVAVTRDGVQVVWIIVHPDNAPEYFVQPKSILSNGRWVTSAYFGDQTTPKGIGFQIQAFADPTSELAEGPIPNGAWPAARLISKLVHVKRSGC